MEKLQGNLVSQEAEEAVIGAMLLSHEVISDVVEILTVEDFATPQLKEIFVAIINLFEENKPVDIITVSEKLREKGILDAVGGSEYLTNLIINTPTTANATYYAKIVKEKSISRKATKKTKELLAAFEKGELQKAQQLLTELNNINTLEAFKKEKDIELITAADLINSNLPITEYLIDGLLPKEGVTLIQGDEKIGKSWLALNLALSLSTGYPFLGHKPTKTYNILYLALEDQKAGSESFSLSHTTIISGWTTFVEHFNSCPSFTNTTSTGPM
ncbi:DnaB domain protein helicase domain protein [Caldicellulosiruptor acetigenus I77R1B]|uniref:DnaB domain protein helicase domain protein n=1 Tax=Caldicellulosiruptor acetigenus (strain ATCC 700853 / DSM 12137 / I77R1B) TaxID=632335 RepID=E4S5Z7_CALA7|nr:DnaB-like helicase N-terminal domain-containing protein [Caldicellulosiruptor acetigenus]ADQ39670.1 DnaB domain protein helicase domain protein [Caldicellulosiruptor acetigenus I77R1B]